MKNLRFDNNIIIIAGPTASGKTRLSIDIALFLEKKIGKQAEIINADSIQMYHDLRTLTAYPSEDELNQVNHTLFGILDAYDISNVALWLEKAHANIERIQKEGKIAIVCGGTGFYIKAIIEGISDIPYIPHDFRKNIFAKFNEIGRDAFFEELSSIDQYSHRNLNKNDTQRILRAYEIASFTGKPLSEWWAASRKANYNPISFVLLPNKEKIHTKSLNRILKMIQKGAIDETKEFNKQYPNYNGPLRNVIGYKEISENTTIDECISLMDTRTKQYIKRQSTWFRNQMKIVNFLFGFGDEKEILDETCFNLINFTNDT